MFVRQARTADAEAVAGIANQVVNDTLITFTTQTRSAAEISERITARGSRFLVADDAGEVLGYATFGPFRAGPGYRHSAEHSIALKPAAQGRGAGRALMERLERVATENDVHVLVAAISGANPGAVKFHAALGFQQVGRMPQVGRKQGQWLDLVLMQKILDRNVVIPT